MITISSEIGCCTCFERVRHRALHYLDRLVRCGHAGFSQVNLERLAKQDNRSLSNYVQNVLKNYLAENGINLDSPTKDKKKS